MEVRGPYRHATGKLKGRAYVNITHDDGSRTSMLYSRYLMQEKLGRTLGYNETVDHINEDPTDDRIENLRILSREENAKSWHKNNTELEMYDFICPVCSTPASKPARFVRNNRKQGKAGPFCSRSCAGRLKAP